MISREERYIPTGTDYISSTSIIPDDQPTSTCSYIGRVSKNINYTITYIRVEEKEYHKPKTILDETQRKHVLKKAVSEIRHFNSKSIQSNQRRNLRANKRDCKWQHLQS